MFIPYPHRRSIRALESVLIGTLLLAQGGLLLTLFRVAPAVLA